MSRTALAAAIAGGFAAGIAVASLLRSRGRDANGATGDATSRPRAHRQGRPPFTDDEAVLAQRRTAGDDLLAGTEPVRVPDYGAMPLPGSPPKTWTWARDARYTVTNARDALDLRDVWHRCKAEYWAHLRKNFRDMVVMWSNSYAVYTLQCEGSVAGFCRVVSDGVTFAYLADLVVYPDHRGHGAGKFFVECVVNGSARRPADTSPCYNFLLTTHDAQSLYQKYGFLRIDGGSRRGQSTEGGAAGDDGPVPWPPQPRSDRDARAFMQVYPEDFVGSDLMALTARTVVEKVDAGGE